MNTYFDIALNLASERFSGERDKVVDTAIKHKVSYFNIVCSSINELDFVKDLNQRYEKNSCFTLGVHPHNASELNNDDEDPLSIRSFSSTFLGIMMAILVVLLPVFSVLLGRPLSQINEIDTNQSIKKDGS